MPGRSFAAGSKYRYGFNGQENSDEITAGLTTAMYWEYDSRIGRRWNLDPKPNISFSLYSVFENNPVWKNDILGDSTSTGSGPGPVKTGTSSYYIDRVNDYLKRNHMSIKYDYKTKKVIIVNSPPTYYLNYGYKYMKKFTNVTKKTLSPQGQKWLDLTLVYLQEAMETKLTKTKDGSTIENDDKKFTDFAFDTHVKAYEKAGILFLPIMDKVKICLTPDAKDLFSDRGLKQAAIIAADQASLYNLIPFFAIIQAKEVFENAKEISTMVHNYYLSNKSFFDKMQKADPKGWEDPEHIIIKKILTPPTFRL